MWKSLVRANELDRRVQKANGAEREMQRLALNDKASQDQKERAEKMQKEIQSWVERVTSLKQVFVTVRASSDAVPSLKDEVSSGPDLARHFEKCSSLLFKDSATLLEVIQVMAKKLVDVPWHIGHYISCPC